MEKTTIGDTKNVNGTTYIYCKLFESQPAGWYAQDVYEKAMKENSTIEYPDQLSKKINERLQKELLEEDDDYETIENEPTENTGTPMNNNAEIFPRHARIG